MTCGPESDKCSINMARINLLAGDLVGAYRSALPGAEAGDSDAIAMLVEICEKAGDTTRAQQWRTALGAAT